MKIHDFTQRKEQGEKLTMLTCYDSWSAELIARTGIDCILVGDSLAMTMHGHDSTLPATPEMMALHVAAVRRGAPQSFIIGDMPFLSHRRGLDSAMETVQLLMQAGASAVKLEGCSGSEELVKHIVASGVPVMGHLGLTPQSYHQLGGYRVQGKEDTAAQNLLVEAETLQCLGCFALVLECVPAELAGEISRQLTIPVIGIGAGAQCDGQVLVLQDMLGLNTRFKPRFVRTFLGGAALIEQALADYDSSVKNGTFPTLEESFT